MSGSCTCRSAGSILASFGLLATNSRFPACWQHSLHTSAQPQRPAVEYRDIVQYSPAVSQVYRIFKATHINKIEWYRGACGTEPYRHRNSPVESPSLRGTNGEINPCALASPSERPFQTHAVRCQEGGAPTSEAQLGFIHKCPSIFFQKDAWDADDCSMLSLQSTNTLPPEVKYTHILPYSLNMECLGRPWLEKFQ